MTTTRRRFLAAASLAALQVPLVAGAAAAGVKIGGVYKPPAASQQAQPGSGVSR